MVSPGGLGLHLCACHELGHGVGQETILLVEDWTEFKKPIFPGVELKGGNLHKIDVASYKVPWTVSASSVSCPAAMATPATKDTSLLRCASCLQELVL